jgi:glycine/D-amino acid oxidase-like deaminating enzyme
MVSLTHPIIVIGGGFYGCSVAEYLALKGARVTLLEQDSELLTRASYNNQARLHNGYHYPRSFGTAYRSRLNFSRFFEEYRPAIVHDFVKLYAIAGPNSKVSPRQFEVFCHNIEAPLQEARPQFTRLFSERWIAAVYETQEYAFDAAIIRNILRERLMTAGVTVKLSTQVTQIQPATHSPQVLEVIDQQGNVFPADFVFNCTYSGLNRIPGITPTHHQLKHEITEMALVELPEELQGISVTVMDGPFFSFMPFPDRQLSTFSHVRYTPHGSWLEKGLADQNPYARLAQYPQESCFNFMIHDAQRLIPCLSETIYRDSLFEVKTVLVKNENDDGRPILFERDPAQPRIVSMLGSKIDNIYDAFAAVESCLKKIPINSL